MPLIDLSHLQLRNRPSTSRIFCFLAILLKDPSAAILPKYIRWLRSHPLELSKIQYLSMPHHFQTDLSSLQTYAREGCDTTFLQPVIGVLSSDLVIAPGIFFHNHSRVMPDLASIQFVLFSPKAVTNLTSVFAQPIQTYGIFLRNSTINDPGHGNSSVYGRQFFGERSF